LVERPLVLIEDGRITAIESGDVVGCVKDLGQFLGLLIRPRSGVGGR
jgi:hypothetical protein